MPDLVTPAYKPGVGWRFGGWLILNHPREEEFPHAAFRSRPASERTARPQLIPRARRWTKRRRRRLSPPGRSIPFPRSADVLRLRIPSIRRQILSAAIASRHA